MFGGDPDLFASRLAYSHRDVEEELAIINVTRSQMARILRTLNPDDFHRKGIHSEDGPLSLETLLMRITGNIPYHINFIEEKKTAMK